VKAFNKKRPLRSGYTTGACAAAAAKAATMLLLSAEAQKRGSAEVKEVEIPFPDGSRRKFRIQDSRFKDGIAVASIIKNAGDDPDVTNGAEICAEVRWNDCESGLIIKGGEGVGVATKRGLPISIGEPAINPVPQKMIQEAVMEALSESADVRKRGSAEAKNLQTSELPNFRTVKITISVTDGEKLAKKTLNSRLGIIGGISILGTTGIVRPISAEAWTATIASSMDVAKAMGHSEIVLSAGRASEKAHMNKFKFQFQEECYVMMGDYLEFALLDAKKHGFKKIHLCAQWAKMLKIAMSTPQTHVRHGALDTKKAVIFLNSLGIAMPNDMQFNTAREMFDFISSSASSIQPSAFLRVCNAAKKYAEEITSDIRVISYLVSYEGEIIANSV
jgi:cobalt-precorrin-5B (C1)-methyltransferase